MKSTRMRRTSLTLISGRGWSAICGLRISNPPLGDALRAVQRRFDRDRSLPVKGRPARPNAGELINSKVKVFIAQHRGGHPFAPDLVQADLPHDQCLIEIGRLAD